MEALTDLNRWIILIALMADLAGIWWVALTIDRIAWSNRPKWLRDKISTLWAVLALLVGMPFAAAIAVLIK
jgi:hypothetical protein